MFEDYVRRIRSPILLYLLIAALIFSAVGVIAFLRFGSPGLTVVDLTVSALLTAALVILYSRQTTILESQHDLLTLELNREARQQHTETLRDRVRIWHGNPDREIADDPLDQPGTNLPAVNDASFESAPTGSFTSTFVEEKSFQVLPYRLEGDRYLDDLLENHAPDLREKKEEIEELYEEFESLRNEFREVFEEGIVCETEDFTFEPADYLDWLMFEYLVSYERGFIEDFSEIRELVRSQLEDGNSSLDSDESRIWFLVNIEDGGRYPVYSANSISADRDELREMRSAAMDEAERLIDQVLDRLEKRSSYDQPEQAAVVLDEAAESIDELEHLLVEYDGRPIYPGDCKYLEEARISGS